MRHKLLFLISAVGFALSAGAKQLEVGALGGYGSTQVVVKSISLSESPLGADFFIDYELDNRYTFGVEHVRSVNISPLSTGVSFTGISGKWYFSQSRPGRLDTENSHDYSTLSQVAYAPYLGGSTGLAQSSLITSEGSLTGASTVGGYLSLHLGMDYPLSSQWAARSELGLTTTYVGTGTVSMMYVLFGIYLHL